MTNGEKVKSMNYWQLAQFINRHSLGCYYNKCPAHAPGCAVNCKRRWLEWLKEEVEEDEARNINRGLG